MATLGGRGGGGKDLAQGGFTQTAGLAAALTAAAETLGS
jgi:alanyl-tRNA synthetase